MLEPLDRCRRDSTLFQFTTKQLRDFIDPNHLLIQIDEQLDFAKLVAPLEERYCPDFGRPAIHPEVMVRALLVCSLYNISSFRRLCSAISENIAFRWFCFLTIDDPVFDHSSITHFIDRIGREGFTEIFDGLNRELLRLGMLSREMYVDSTLVKANVSGYGLANSGMTVEDFKEQAVEENGLFKVMETTVDEDGARHETARYFQNPKGRLPLNPVDTDARWRTTRAGRASGCSTRRTSSWTAAVSSSPGRNPRLGTGIQGGCGSGREAPLASGFSGRRQRVQRWETAAAAGGTEHHGLHSHPHEARDQHGLHWGIRLPRRPSGVPEGKILRRGSFHKGSRTYQYVARQKDCQACPVKESCLPPKQKRRYFTLTMYYPEYLRARERNRTEAYRQEIRRRQTIAEGTFASLDRLSWTRTRLRGLWKVDCEGYMAALATT